MEHCDKKSDRIGDKNGYEKKLIQLRKKVNELFFMYRLSRSMIARKIRVSRNFVIKWTLCHNQDCSLDRRGWRKAKRRKWTEQTEGRIKTIYDNLQNNPHDFIVALRLSHKNGTGAIHKNLRLPCAL